MPDPDIPALLADPRVVWADDILRFADTDANGHINNATFGVLCESGRVTLLRTVLGPTRRPGGYFVLARVLIEFKAELLYPGRTRSGTWIRHLGRTSVGMGQVILGPENRLVATSEAVTVSMDAETRRPRPLEDETRAVAEARLRRD